jgi:hypothetical protein
MPVWGAVGRLGEYSPGTVVLQARIDRHDVVVAQDVHVHEQPVKEGVGAVSHRPSIP